MRTVALLSALVALLPIPVLAQPPSPLALSAVALSLSGLNATLSSSDEALAALPEAPAAAIMSVRNLTPQPCASSTSPTRKDQPNQNQQPCRPAPDPYQRFLNTSLAIHLTPLQKAHLALRNLDDPGNIATIFGSAAFTVGTNAHTAYGPGWTGFARNAGYLALQDATGEFFGTFLISSIAHQDPYYRRMPHAAMPRRALHAIVATFAAQTDTGRTIPDYANLLTGPICTEISNLYVPGVNGNGPSTAARIITGYATMPADNLITEFLPDLARRVHIRVIFVQSLLNQISNDQYSLP